MAFRSLTETLSLTALAILLSALPALAQVRESGDPIGEYIHSVPLNSKAPSVLVMDPFATTDQPVEPSAATVPIPDVAPADAKKQAAQKPAAKAAPPVTTKPIPAEILPTKLATMPPLESVSETVVSTASPEAQMAALAKAPATFQPVGEWQVRTVVRDATAKDGTYCLLEQPYTQDFQLNLALNQAQQLNLGLILPRAGLKAGDKYSLTLQVDGGNQRVAVGVAKTGELLVADIGNDAAFLDALARGMNLVAVATVDYTSFSLRNFARGIKELRACTHSLGTLVMPDAASPIWPEPIRALLDSAGLSYATPVLMSTFNPYERPVDYGWRLGPVFGGMRERAAVPGAELRDLANSYDAAFARRCTEKSGGKYSSSYERPQASGSAQSVVGTIYCLTPDNRTTTVAVLYQLSSTNKFTLVIHESDRRDLPQAMAARDAVRKALERVYAPHSDIPPNTPVTLPLEKKAEPQKKSKPAKAKKAKPPATQP